MTTGENPFPGTEYPTANRDSFCWRCRAHMAQTLIIVGTQQHSNIWPVCNGCAQVLAQRHGLVEVSLDWPKVRMQPDGEKS